MEVIHAEERGFCVGTHGCLIVVIWGRAAEVGDLWQIAAADRRAIAQHGHCAAIMIIRARPTMGCHFRLDRPERGLKGGGQGDCQVSTGERVTAVIPLPADGIVHQ
jgi:hypothetical protein